MLMADNHWLWSFDSEIPSEIMAGKKLIEQLLLRLAEFEWPDHDVFGIHLAAEEAIANAIKHGNQDDPSKSVAVCIDVARDKLRIRVADQGCGFNANDLPDPTADENLELPSGRGIMLMRSFMNSVEFNECGNCVTMWKERNP